MNERDIEPNQIIHRGILERQGFRISGHTMYKLIHGEELRFCKLDDDANLYVFEGRFSLDVDHYYRGRPENEE